MTREQKTLRAKLRKLTGRYLAPRFADALVDELFDLIRLEPETTQTAPGEPSPATSEPTELHRAQARAGLRGKLGVVLAPRKVGDQ